MIKAPDPAVWNDKWRVSSTTLSIVLRRQHFRGWMKALYIENKATWVILDAWLCVSDLRVRVSMYALVCELWGEIPLSGLGVLPVVELCLYSLALSGYPTLPMSEREGEMEGWQGGERGASMESRREGGSEWGRVRGQAEKVEQWMRQWSS